MKKLLAIVLCVCLALTISLTAMAAPSPENSVIIRKGDGTAQDGSSIPEDTYVSVAEDNTVTIKAGDEKVYGKFDSWSIYVLQAIPGTTKYKAVAAKLNVDYVIVSGSLDSDTLVIKPLTKISVCGNYADTVTDPLSVSSVPGTKTDKGPKTGDMSAMYIAVLLLAGCAFAFGAKRQLSK